MEVVLSANLDRACSARNSTTMLLDDIGGPNH